MKLGDLGDLFDGPHATPTRRDNGPYFLNIASLNNGRIDLEKSDHVSETEFQKWTRRITPQAGDLLFSYETRLGEAALMPAGIQACLGRRMALLRPNLDVVDPQFLLYWYLSPQMQNLIYQHRVLGATVPRILLSEMPSWRVSLPSLPAQQAIAEVLGALDDKIAANRSLTNVTGQLTAALFVKMTGHLPSASLSNYAQVNGLSVKRGTGTLRYLDIASVSAGYYEYPTEMDWNSAPGRARRRVQRGDTVWSTVRPNRRSHALILDDSTNLICSTGLATLTPKSPGFSFVFESSRTTAFTDYLIQNAKGSAYPAVNAARFAEAPVPSASTEEVDAFNALCDPLWERAAGAMAESRTLARLRDTLLPALMDGRLRVRDAVEQVEGAL